jgi:excisionase family DNA binding protein
MDVQLVEQIAQAVAARLSKTPRQEWYSIKEAAQVVGLSASYVRRAVVAGHLPVSNMGSMQMPLYRLYRDDLMAWMRRREAKPCPPPRKRPQAPLSEFLS